MRGHPGFTLIELAVAMAVLAVLVATIAPAYIGPQQQARDSTAKDAADKAAANLQYYMAMNGAYPVTPNPTWWPQMITALGQFNQLPAATPSIFGNFMAWTGPGNPPTTFQIAFVAAGGTGAWYCRDQNGLATIAAPPGWGPWTGCP